MSRTPERWQHLQPFEYKLLKSRIEQYDQIMALKNDVLIIAKTYKLPEVIVQRAKDYAFGSGVATYEFYPDNDMADAWLRLAADKGNDLDEIFLKHEIHESDLVINQNISQPLAHQKTQKLYPWSRLLKERNL